MDTYVVQKKIDIHAEPAKVWDALTNPQKTKKYFFHCEVFSDWKEGRDITFKGRKFLFFKIELKGKILRAEPDRLLKYTLINRGKNASASTVTDVLSYENEITTLTVTDDVGQGPGAEKRFKQSDKGWDKVLKGLKKLVEEEK